MKRKITLLALLVCVSFGLRAQFMSTHSNGMDHNHYSVESIDSDIILGGTVYPAGQTNNTDIHIQRLDASGSIMWEIYHDIGTDERCLDIGLQGEDYILVTGTATHDGRNRAFMMRLNQFDGSFIDMVFLIPDIYSNHLDQMGLEVIYSETTNRYFIAGKAFADINEIAWAVQDEIALVICLDANLNNIWSNEVRDAMPSSLAKYPIAGAFNVVEIPGKGICIGADVSTPRVIHYDYAGNMVWDINSISLVNAPKGLVYDAATDRLLISCLNLEAVIAEIVDASTSGAALNRIVDFKDFWFAHQYKFTPGDIIINNNGTISLLGHSSGPPFLPVNAFPRLPTILTLDYSSLSLLNVNVLEHNDPGHSNQELHFFTDLPHPTLSDRYTPWGDGFAVLGYNYSSYGGLNTYNLTVNQTDLLGFTEEPCENSFDFKTYSLPKTPNPRVLVYDDMTHDVEPYFASSYLNPHDQNFGCFEQEPCNITVNAVNIENILSCEIADFSVDVTAGSGTYITQYFWNWGDGTSTVTTTPFANHAFLGYAVCAYTVCVTVTGIGSNGNSCTDHGCYSVTLPFTGFFGGFMCPNYCLPKLNVAGGETSNDIIEQTAIQLYPNPTSNQFVLEGLSGVAQLVISDVTGRIVHTGSVSNNVAVDVSNFRQGVYFVKVQDEAGDTFTEKLIVE